MTAINPNLSNELILEIMSYLPISEQVRAANYRLCIVYDDIACVTHREKRIVKIFKWAIKHNIVPLMISLESCTKKSSPYSLLWTLGHSGKKAALEKAIKHESAEAFSYLLNDLAKYGFRICLYCKEDYRNNENSNLRKALNSPNQEIVAITRKYMPTDFRLWG